MIFCGLMVYQIFDKYINYPVLITFSMKETRLQQIPFPAVTICPRAKFSLSHFNITAVLEKMKADNITEEEAQKIGYASAVCEFSHFNKTESYSREGFYKFLNESRPSSIFKYCSYLEKEPDCTEFFKPILTEEGVCYSFNILDKTDMFRDNVEFNLPDFHSTSQIQHWDVESGFTASQIHTYPQRALRIGQKNAFYVLMKTRKSDIEYECPMGESGYRVILHFPSCYPDVTENHFTVPLGQSVTGVIIPHMIKTSEGVKRFHPQTRDCYFQSERPLKYFKVYTQANCLLECKTNYTLDICGCVGFHMPKTEGTPICLMEKLYSCMENVEWDVFYTVYNDYAVVEEEVKHPNFTQCDCRPMCTDVSYRLEMSQNPILYSPGMFAKINDKEEFPMMHYSVLNLYFKTNHIETRERNELYSLSDVISNFGGLLGLFTGFSILSATEIVYFLSLRIWGNIKLFGHWSGPVQN
ncbi:unnamed protein product [Acanthoscelides obtectus]|nr:unnamed protein product [Acanthoscelides obtectus]CAK1663751.1 Pickpocket protein 28 [Acanthoscelides obtectus]